MYLERWKNLDLTKVKDSVFLLMHGGLIGFLLLNFGIFIHSIEAVTAGALWLCVSFILWVLSNDI